jgi:hypothetical protein
MSVLIDQARNRVPRIAGVALAQARLTVVPRRRPKAPRIPFVMLVSLILVGGVAGLLTFNTSMQQASFTATALEARASMLTAQEQGLQMRIARLRDPQQVAILARAMGMVPPSSPAFLRLRDGKVLGTLTPALAADAVRIRSLPTRKPKDLRPRPVIVKRHPKAGGSSGRHSAGHSAGPGAGASGATGAASASGGGPTGTKKTHADHQQH